VKIASWNVNSVNVRLAHVLDWLAQNEPDILALQETKTPDPQFPLAALAEAGYRAAIAGQKGYNGVALVTRAEAEEVVRDIPALDSPERRILGATIGGVRVLNLYVVNGQEVGSEKYAYKLDWLARVTEHVARELAAYPRLVVLGDFNIAPEDRDVHDPEAWHERVLCSTPEREAFRRMLDLGLVDTFRLFDQPERTFSWWDYRAVAFRRNLGLRIDLILASHLLAEHCTACTIDPAPRKLDRPSDHAPVVATFDL
jgi:exodeoxyribonuclease-3